MTGILISMRPRQWTKNLLLLAGIVFTARFGEAEAWRTVGFAILSFCFLSSAGYLFNDILDRGSDALHPEKRHRPVAAGTLKPTAAASAAILLAAFAVAFAWMSHTYALYSVAAYSANQLLYMLVARSVAILDVFVISFGFLIRAVAGAAVLEERISVWLLLCTLLLALFLGFSKRRHEFRTAGESRGALRGYTLPLLNQLIGISASAAVIAYSLYAIQSETGVAHPLLAYTIPLPMFGVFRYLQIVFRNNGGGSPDAELVRDPWIWGTLILWMALSVFAMSQGTDVVST